MKKTNLLLFLLLGVFFVSPKSVLAVDVNMYDVHEIPLTASSGTITGYSDTNKYTNVLVTATFNGPGEVQNVIEGFWNGGNSWEVRFTPTIQGQWTYSIDSTPNDAGLEKFGSFTCVAPQLGNHGFIRVDGYHFRYDDNTLYFMLGTTAYSIVNYASDGTNDYQNTIDFVKSHNINKMRILIDPWVPTRGVSSYPFLRTDGEPNHDRLNIAHWQKFDEIVQYCSLRGVTADIIIFRDDPGGHGTVAQDIRRVKYIITRYSAYKNVIWCLRNEWPRIVTKDKEYWKTIGDTVVNNDPWIIDNSGRRRPLSIHTTSTGSSGGHFEFFDYSWPSHVCLHYHSTFTPDGTYREYDITGNEGVIFNLGHNMPIVNDEQGYVGCIVRSTSPDSVVTRERARQGLWAIYVSGGYHSIGDDFNQDGDYLNDGDNWQHGDYYDGSFMGAYYDDVKRLYEFFNTILPSEGINYWQMTSGDDLVTGSRVYTLADPANAYVIYAAVGNNFTLDVGANIFNVYLYNPRTGAVSQRNNITGSATITPPDKNDWVYYIARMGTSRKRRLKPAWRKR